MDEIGAIIVGFGSMGRNHLETLRARAGTRILGIIRHTLTPEDPGCPVFGSLGDGLARKPTLAIISTPHAQHYAEARECLQAGCHVLVEKPLALRYSHCVELVELAAKQQRLLVVGLQRRYEGFARVFRAALADGSLGHVEFVHGFFAHRFSADMLRGWRSDPSLAGAGILDDSALHLMDLLVYFAAGRVTRAHARVVEGSGDPLPHSFAAILDTDSGATVSATGSYLSPARTVQEELTILGTAGALFARRFCREWNPEPPAVFYKSADGSVARDHDMTAYPYGRELPLTVLLDVLQGKADRAALLTEAVHVLETHRAMELLRVAARS